jgi:rhodanese-related sulfurtransferase
MSNLRFVRIILLALSGAFLSAACAGPDNPTGPTLSAPEAFEKSRAGEITMIDIRTPREWRATGIAAGALPIDMTRKTFVQEILDAVDGDKGAPIAIICRTGNRTTYTQKALQELGFTNVYNVKEGMAGSGAGPGWVRQGLPVEACQTC